MKSTHLSHQHVTRRQFVARAAALGLPFALFGNTVSAILPNRYQKTDLGVNLGVISYSFRSMPSTADDILHYMVQLGLTSIELMGGPIEAFAGAPEGPGWRRPKSD